MYVSSPRLLQTWTVVTLIPMSVKVLTSSAAASSKQQCNLLLWLDNFYFLFLFFLIVCSYNGSALVESRLVLAPSNKFGFDLSITNIALDTSISSTLLIAVPEQLRLEDTVNVLC